MDPNHSLWVVCAQHGGYAIVAKCRAQGWNMLEHLKMKLERYG